jgi:molybdate transport system regulatory protein
MADSKPDLTTRNRLAGTVAGVVTGTVMAEVTVAVGGEQLVAVITRHSAERLGLAQGDAVTVLIKATEVMLAKGSDRLDRLTTRNQVAGTVTAVQSGNVMAEVTIDAGGGELVAAVTRASVERLGLAAGDDVVALIKATEVMLAK